MIQHNSSNLLNSPPNLISQWVLQYPCHAGALRLVTLPRHHSNKTNNNFNEPPSANCKEQTLHTQKAPQRGGLVTKMHSELYILISEDLVTKQATQKPPLSAPLCQRSQGSSPRSLISMNIHSEIVFRRKAPMKSFVSTFMFLFLLSKKDTTKILASERRFGVAARMASLSLVSWAS